MTRRPACRAAVLGAALVLAATALVGCGSQSGGGTTAATGDGGGSQSQEQSQQPQTPGGEPLYTATYKAAGDEVAVFKTEKGTFEVQLHAADAPNTVAAFVELVQRKFYDGVKVQRLIPGFVIQAGDPITKDLSREQIQELAPRIEANQALPTDPPMGQGSAGFRLKAEFNERKHVEGSLAMARAMDPDSAGSQFYIALAPLPQLDGSYTVFGQVVKGLDVVRKVELGDTIETVTIVHRK